jgi:hypothetical protein
LTIENKVYHPAILVPGELSKDLTDLLKELEIIPQVIP